LVVVFELVDLGEVERGDGHFFVTPQVPTSKPFGPGLGNAGDA
jgi:hypothetical protein